MQPFEHISEDYSFDETFDQQSLLQLAAETASSIGNPHLLQVYSHMVDVHMQHYHVLMNSLHNH
ncbi:hypothetical protein SD71_11640 [Cohnella kolymensis]|uniref:Uncharacterized protein n=1 Tax=Cohnella kolymensis TaxID=1590652 RepID=A0ABR5A5Y9_9BACL|nr:hypothetical protein [Cohnella kolymensis]KIL35980.1 hypothetical protein SD71_11640 [Cohnella kolymensis]